MRERTLSRATVVLMSVATGVIVANLYYLQPLLHEIRGDFSIDTLAASALNTLMQVGYVTGLALILPLGDIVARRRLIVAIFVTAAAAMLLASFIHSYALFAVVTVIIGLTSVGGQVMIPFAADLAAPAQRGRVVARVVSGLLLGVLLSRTLSGIASEAFGWRGVYVLAAALLAVMATVLRFALPPEPARAHVAYHRLVTSTFSLFATYPVLRQRAFLGAICFAGFSALWSTLAFHLSAAPFHYSGAVIGLFGLIGVAGVVAANAAGHLADHDRSQFSTLTGVVLLAVAFALLLVGARDVWVLASAIFLMDAGVQTVHVTNQSIIYALAPEMRSRINSAYMVCFFAGASLGSLGAGLAYSHFAWSGTCVLGLVIGAVGTGAAIRWRPSRENATAAV